MDALNTCIGLRPVILDMIKRPKPKGGVMVPIKRFKIRIIPKCTVFTPIPVMMGIMMGIVKIMIEEVSKKVPKIRSTALTNNIITSGFWDMLKKYFVIVCGTCSAAKDHPRGLAAAMRKRIVEDVIATRRNIPPNSRKVISRKIKSDNISA